MLAAFKALNSVFMAPREIGQCRKSDHQVVHSSALGLYIGG
jgi:hypothetical protein